MKTYPDVSELFKAKRANRRSLAKLPFEEKISIVRRLQRLHKSIKGNALALHRKTRKKN